MATGRYNGVEVIKNITFDHTSSPPYPGDFNADGQLLIGSATTDPNRVAQAGELTSSDSSVSISYSFPDLDLTVDTSMIPTVPTTFQTDSGSATPAANTLIVAGGHDINTTGAGNIVSIELDNAITLGDLSAIAAGSNALSCTTGDINIAAGNMKLPATNAALTQGVLTIAGSSLRMHTFGSSNIFIGPTAGNGTLSGAENNIGIGLNSESGLTSGDSNVAIGDNCLRNVSTGSSNCGVGIATLTTLTTSVSNSCFGHNSGNLVSTGSGRNSSLGFQTINKITTGSDNTALGYQAGFNYTSTETNNICIGASVTGTLGESGVTRIGVAQTACYIDGIDGVNVGSTATVVTEASDRLGTAVITAGTGITVTPGANTITLAVSGSSVGQTITGDSGGALSPTAGNWNILGGPGVTTSGSGSTLTINSVVFTDQTATTLTSDSGTFATAAGAFVLPASPAQGEVIEIVALASGVIVTGNTGQEIRIGSALSASAGTATSTAAGDALKLRYRSSDTRWYAISVIGTWTVV